MILPDRLVGVKSKKKKEKEKKDACPLFVGEIDMMLLIIYTCNACECG